MGKEGTILPDGALQKYAQLLRGQGEKSKVLSVFQLEMRSQLRASLQRGVICSFVVFASIPECIYI